MFLGKASNTQADPRRGRDPALPPGVLLVGNTREDLGGGDSPAAGFSTTHPAFPPLPIQIPLLLKVLAHILPRYEAALAAACGKGLHSVLKYPWSRDTWFHLLMKPVTPGPLTLGPGLSLVCVVGSWETDSWEVLSEKQSSFRL